MLNPALVLETALLILVAFLLGCALGYLARRLTMPKPKAAAATTAKVEPATTPAGPALVVAPAIAPLPAKPQTSYASRLAAAAGRPEPEAVDVPAAASAPAPEPGSLLSTPEPVLEAPTPVTESTAPVLEVAEPAPAPLETAPSPAEPVLASRPAEPVVAAIEPIARPVAESPPSVIYLGPSTDAASAFSEPRPVANAPPSIDVPEPTTDAPATPVEVAPPVVPEPPPEPVRAEDVPQIEEAAHVIEPSADLVAAEPIAALEPVAAAAEPPPTRRSEPPSEDAESAAMRAIEGNWTPRRAAPSRPVPHPEHTGVEIDAAMASARSAVAAATAAATAAIAENIAPPALDFDSTPEASPQTFLADAALEPEPTVGPAGLAFEPARPRFGYGRPEGLSAPRGGRPDNLKQIKGMTAAVESSLYELGIYHFDQLAALDQKAVVWLDHNLALHGRIGREKWLEQARDLSRGRQHALRPVRR